MSMEDRVMREEKTVLVAVQMDGNGRDLVRWAVGNAAEAGDRVLAVHVYRGSDLRNQSLTSLTKALNDYLSEHQSSCNARQVFLMGRLAQGSSIRKAVVKEAETCGANAVVVGVNKNATFRGSASLSKYCSRKLPPAVSLFAVQNGKVVYERKAAALPRGGADQSARSKALLPNLSMKSEGAISLTKDENGVEIASQATSVRGSVEDGVAASKSLRRKRESLRSISLLVEKFPEKPSGWPLLQRASSMDLSATRGDEAARNMSVVQWVMSLPDRSQQSPQGSDASLSPFEMEHHPQYAELYKKLEAVIDASSSGCRWYSRAEIDESTNHFSPDNLIGNGGCSRVYHGSLPDGEEIAVKVTKLSIESLREFVLETDIITALRHDRIIRLRGVCVEEGEITSVYEFFSRGSLEDNLHGKKATTPLPWNARYKVALGTAEALSYMHSIQPSGVIHRDIKSSNILLSDNFEPQLLQLADFGLAVWAPHSSSSITYNDVVGTFGYLAPEYFMYGKVSDKMDVYSFGVVLLELVTGRKPICSEVSRGHESLVMWVTKLVEQGDLTDLLHSSIDAECDTDQIRRMVLAASISIRRVARLRPTMSQVAALLRGEEEIESWVRSHSINTTDEQNNDEEAYPPSSVASHLGVAFQDIDDAASISSIEQSYHNLEEYLRGRCSRSSSFD